MSEIEEQNQEMLNAGMKVGLAYGLYRWIFPRGCVGAELEGWEQAVAEYFGITVVRISEVICGVAAFIFVIYGGFDSGVVTGILSFLFCLGFALFCAKWAAKVGPVIVGVASIVIPLWIIGYLLTIAGCPVY